MINSTIFREASEFVEIDEKTGDLRVKKDVDIDREKIESFVIKVAVTDSAFLSSELDVS